MPALSGDALEARGRDVLDALGLTCIPGRRQAALRDLDPAGAHPDGAHLELDYLVPAGAVCAVGEITSRGDPANARRKYQRFVQAFNVLETTVARLPAATSARDRFWSLLGVGPERLRNFRPVRALRGFFIATALDRYDTDFPDAPRVAIFYQADWARIAEYAEAVGRYGKPMMLHALGISTDASAAALQVGRGTGRALHRTEAKKIAGGDIALADVYTFEASPYELLDAARVLRRDQLPDLEAGGRHYQRPLEPAKLQEIRASLLGDLDFMFPGNVLVVLGARAEYRDGVLTIPVEYGAVNVIDGQHRLFSYADDAVAAVQRPAARLAVTAVQFETVDERVIDRHSAQIFIEINTNQTSVPRAHLYAIGYPILGHTTPNALGAQILIGANERHGALYGLLDVNQNAVGVIQPLTLLTTLRAFLNTARVERVADAQRGAARARRAGYEALLGADDLVAVARNPDAFIRHGAACVGRYFDEVARAFPHDFPTRQQRAPASALRFAKVLAGFIRLLQAIGDEGGGWPDVRTVLHQIRANVLTARGVGPRTRVVFADDDPAVPDANHRPRQVFTFLDANRRAPTSMATID